MMLLAACGSKPAADEPTSAPAHADATEGLSPGASGSFGGSYEVPVSPALAAAARYDMTEIEWVVAGGTARLHYNLPRALVGSTVSVDFVGTFDGKANHVTLTGAAGTAECALSATEIVCTEAMHGLLPIDADLGVVEKLAADYAGAASDRIAVSRQFAVDPIGIARLDLARPGTPEAAEQETETDARRGGRRPR